MENGTLIVLSDLEKQKEQKTCQMRKKGLEIKGVRLFPKLRVKAVAENAIRSRKSP